jgi:hypothetical protein
MKPKIMLAAHKQETITRAVNSGGQYIIAVQDTTYYNYTGHSKMSGIGKIQGKLRGILQHNLMLLSEKGLPLGVLYQDYWTRQGGSLDLKLGKKESLKWSKGLAAVRQESMAIPQKIVLVEDREADMFDFFKEERGEKIELLVRLYQPRKLEMVSNGEVKSLSEMAESLSEYGKKTVYIRRKNREVQLTIRMKAGQVDVYPRQGLSPRKHKIQGLSLVVAEEIACVDVKTQQPVESTEDIGRWLLLTSLPIENLLDVSRVVDFYALRWRIEQFHFVLKSGALNVEKLQFDDVHTLTNALSFYSVIAWQLLAMTYQVRECSEAAATQLLSVKQVQLLQNITRHSITTVADVVLALGKLLGFAPSKRQPFPGVKILGQALERFHFIEVGFSASRASPS